MNRPAVAADAVDDRGAIVSPTGRAADVAGSADSVEILSKFQSLPIYLYTSAATAPSAGLSCWRGDGGRSPGRRYTVSAPSTPAIPHAPEAMPHNTDLSVRPADPQSDGSEASPALPPHQPRSYRASVQHTPAGSAIKVLGRAINAKRPDHTPTCYSDGGGGPRKSTESERIPPPLRPLRPVNR